MDEIVYVTNSGEEISSEELVNRNFFNLNKNLFYLATKLPRPKKNFKKKN